MKISLVVPVYNEEQAIPVFYETVRRELVAEPYEVEIVFVNDGSTDRTEALCRQLALADGNVLAVSFSRNFGKEAALFAGLEYAGGDAVVPIDVDLQDPVQVVPLLVGKWREGAKVVLAKRRSRATDSFFKRETARGFYRLHNWIASTKIEKDVGDFRLMDREVVEVIKTLPEHQIFMKGILSWAGFDTAIVEYDRAQRSAGNSKFNGWKLWNLALEGITSFSTVPLRLWTYIGGCLSLFSIFYAFFIAAQKLLFGNPVAGYPSLIFAVLFLGGVQLIGIGVLGEYIGRIYMEAKHRPRYVVKGVVRRGDSLTVPRKIVWRKP
ncbi:glycosyltransferase family 2 protein [Pseudomonas vanderleydeniana]|uniref:Glycosyltransferase family 2 protein n=1 Tax=Pseudomonas vanderleydeniana TaxID=2745495 RepID=A0A9E6TRK9_9PSED|nr:glycosyltransferase family 2 protein [Pseudomonas vanderleydeniana]QXI27536.1 glycosyltransferase family 2 protein [Pseudomonas vanderleydeniana]